MWLPSPAIPHAHQRPAGLWRLAVVLLVVLAACGRIDRRGAATPDPTSTPAIRSTPAAAGTASAPSGPGARGTASPAVPVAAITVDTGVAHQTMDGFGSSVRLWDDPHVSNAADPATGRGYTLTTAQQDEILDRLYVELGLTRARPIIDRGIEPENDNADPSQTDDARFQFAWKRNDGYVEYVKRAQARGLRTAWLSPLRLEPWMDRGDPAEVAEWALAVLRRWRALGVELPYYAIVNEPGFERSGYWSGEELREVIKALGPRLRAEGFATKIVITDDFNATEAHRRCRVILADEAARQHVGALAYHLYGGEPADRARMAELGRQYGLPVWMSEFADAETPLAWAAAIHDLIANHNVSAVDAMWGFFGDWDKPGTHLIALKGEGTRYLGYDPTKYYYVTGQFSRFVRPGARRVGVTDAGSGVKLTAYREGRRVVLVAVNDGEAERTTTLRLSAEPGIRQLAAVRTSATEDWASLPPVTARDGVFAVTFPPGSVTTLLTDGETSNPAPRPPGMPTATADAWHLALRCRQGAPLTGQLRGSKPTKQWRDSPAPTGRR